MSNSIQRIGGISLRKLLPNAKFHGAKDFQIQSCCSDPAKVQKGDVFVAIVDSQRDGHAGINQAVANGASAIVAERFVVSKVPLCVVKDSRIALAQICQSLAGNPTESMRVIGVTGTNGKTTTAHLIRSILKEAGLRCGIASSLGNFDGVETSNPNSEITQTPQIAKQLLNMCSNGCEVAILEMPSTLLAQRCFDGIKLDAAVFTNIRKDHLEFHGTPGNYRKAKSQLFKLLKPDGFSVFPFRNWDQNQYG